jgi:hypothetical protein
MIASKVESKIFGDKFVRTGEMGTVLRDDEALADSLLSLEGVKTHLSYRDFISYRVTTNQGNKKILQA